MKSASRLGTTFIACLLGLAAAPIALAQGFLPADANQRGLSGVWADPARPDQKVFIDIAPGSAGNGQVFGGWLTFDSSGAGTPDAQRWYTLQGEVSSTEADTQLTLYRSTQGRFDAPSPLKTEVAGSAILRFEDCYSGSLRYSIKASGASKEQNGAVSLRRTTPSLACRNPLGAATADAPASVLSGTWYQPATGGQGFLIDVDQRSGTLSAGWFTYAGDAATTPGPRWFTLQAPLGADVTHLVDVPIQATTGGSFARNGSGFTARVGTAQLTFSSCDGARLAYRFDAGENAGLSGEIELVRLLAQPCDDTAFRIPGHVVVPDGVNPAELTALGAFSETAVDAQGNFVLPRTGRAPAFTGIVHPDGGAVQFGMLDAELDASATFDARSSAVALLFQAIGTEVLTTDQRRNMIRLIERDPGATALAAIIAAEQARDAFVMDHLSQPILDSIGSVVRGWASPTLAASAASLRRALRFVTRAFSTAADDGGSESSAPQQLLITGNASAAGFTVLLGDNSSVIVQNTKRRPGAARAFVTGYTDADGNHVDLPIAELQGDKSPIPATRRLTAFSALGSIGSLISAIMHGEDVATGTIPWSPIESPAIPVSGRDGALTTDVDLVVMTGVWNGQRPALAGNYATYADLLGNDLFLLRAKQVFDATIMAILENLGIGGAAVSNLPEDTTIRLLNYASGPDFDAILLQIREGTSFYGAFRGLISYLDKAELESLFEEETYYAAIEQYTLGMQETTAVNAAALQVNLQQVQTAATNARNKLVNASRRVIAAVSIVLAGVDTVAQGADQLNGDEQISFFHLKVVRPTLRLEPRQSEISLGETVKLKATVRGFEDDPNLYYSWILDSADQSLLDDLQGNHVAGSGSFDSPSHEVSFITGELITRPDVAHTVTVQVYYRNRSGAYELFGAQTARITLTGYHIVLSPNEVTMRHDQQRTFNINIAPFPDEATLAALQYDWSADTNGYCGTLTSAGVVNSAAQPVVTTHSAHATYAGDAGNPPGCLNDTVHVTLFTLTDGVRKNLGSAEALVVFNDFDIVFPAISPVQINSATTIAATLSPAAPADATVVWTWSVSGNANIQSQNDSGGIGSAIVLRAGAATGTATVTVGAKVTLSNGLVENLGTRTRQVQIVDNGTTPVTSGAVLYYTTDQCSVAYVEFPRVANANYYRFTQVSGLGTLGIGPSNNTGGSTITQPPFSVVAGNVYDVIDTPVAVSCASAPGYSLIGTASTVRVVLARALIIDGNPTPSWTAAWEAEFRAAYGSAVIDAEAFHSDIAP